MNRFISKSNASAVSPRKQNIVNQALSPKRRVGNHPLLEMGHTLFSIENIEGWLDGSLLPSSSMCCNKDDFLAEPIPAIHHPGFIPSLHITSCDATSEELAPPLPASILELPSEDICDQLEPFPFLFSQLSDHFQLGSDSSLPITSEASVLDKPMSVPALVAPKTLLDTVSSSSSSCRPSLSRRAKGNPIYVHSQNLVPTLSKKKTDRKQLRDYQNDNWRIRYKELCEFCTVHGHCLVPHAYKKNIQMARWVKRQRYQYKRKLAGKPNSLTDERILALDEIGFSWSAHEERWEQMLDKLKEFREHHGHCDVPSERNGRKGRYQKLSAWVKCQRRNYKQKGRGKPCGLTPERINELESLDFTWRLRKT